MLNLSLWLFDCSGKLNCSPLLYTNVYPEANKWVHLTSMELFTCNDAKHERKKMQTLMLTVNRP